MGIGDVVGARLISDAGSLTNLAKYPASTVQILGAEKALFRALKKKGNTPKYGLIFHSSFIGRAAAKNKGRISRFLANKCTIASRIDCFSEQSNNIYGNKLKEQVEDRLKFFETGEIPKKNMDVMTEAMELIKKDNSEFQTVSKKDKKKKKKSAEEPMEVAEEAPKEIEPVTPKSEKKKKKKKASEESEETTESEKTEVVEEAPIETVATPKSEKKKKKKKNAEEEEESAVVEAAVEAVETPKSEKKKKKKKDKASDE